VDVLNGVENTISGPAVTYQVNPTIAARAGFTPEEVAVNAAAVLEGEPAATPVILNDRRLHRSRSLSRTKPLLARQHEQCLLTSSGRTATLGSLATLSMDPGQTEIRREELAAPRASHRGASRVWTWATGIAAVQKTVGNLHLPSSMPRRIWRPLCRRTEIIR